MSYQNSRVIENIVDNEEEYCEELSASEEVVEMVIELDSQNSVTIEIRPDDDPVTLAKKFCYQYNIDPKIINSFAKNIKNIQSSSFNHAEGYSSLIHKEPVEKQNTASHSNVLSRAREHSLSKSKATNKKNHTTTYNNEDTVDQRSAAWSQVNASRSSVFQRLYQDSKVKNARKGLNKSRTDDSQMQEGSNRVLNESLYHNTSSESFHQVKIYQKNRKLKAEAAKRNEQLKDQMMRMEESKCKNQPEINPLSRLIADKLRQNNSNIMMRSRQKNILKTIDYLREREAKELEECTFHPKILEKSRRQMLNTDRYLLLHEDHSLRQLKIQTAKGEQLKKMFKNRSPFINKVSKKLVSGRSFSSRMSEYQEKAARNRQKILKQASVECKFLPVTGKQPSSRSKGNMSIGQYLYSKSLEKKKNISENSQKYFLNKKSSKLYEEIKKQAFRYIFTLMDSDEDGLISSLKINILGLQTEVLHLLAPLLCEMEDLQIELDEQQFVDSLDRLFTTFNVHQKNMVLNVYKNPQRKSGASQEPSFHPSLNEKSIQIARDIREPGISLYELGRQRSMEKQLRLNQLRALRAMMEYEQCTFHPNLFHHHN